MMKIEMPDELQQAMKLNDEQFSNMRLEMQEYADAYLKIIADLGLSDSCEMMGAFRPTPNTNNQFFAMRYQISRDSLSVEGFKPMNRSEYIEYCIEEFEEAPEDLVSMN